MNSKSYGIALEGDFDKEESMTDGQFKLLSERIKLHKNRIKNELEIVEHNRFNKTS